MELQRASTACMVNEVSKFPRAGVQMRNTRRVPQQQKFFGAGSDPADAYGFGSGNPGNSRWIMARSTALFGCAPGAGSLNL
jgi:hypothetical protein